MYTSAYNVCPLQYCIFWSIFVGWVIFYISKTIILQWIFYIVVEYFMKMSYGVKISKNVHFPLLLYLERCVCFSNHHVLPRTILKDHAKWKLLACSGTKSRIFPITRDKIMMAAPYFININKENCGNGFDQNFSCPGIFMKPLWATLQLIWNGTCAVWQISIRIIPM